MFLIFIVLLFAGVPIAFSLGLSSLFYLAVSGTPLVLLSQKVYSGIDSFTLLCISAFMLAGALMNTGGITRRIFKFCNALVGHIRGSLAMVNVLDSMFFAGISGTAIADVCSLGAMIIPAMVEEGYEDDFSVALTASTSVMGPIIPPSVPMVIAGSAVSISVGKMFAGGILVGLLMGAAFMAVVWYIAKKRNYPKHQRHTLRQIFSTTREAIWALLMPLILMFGIMGGFFTPTEASIVTVMYSLIVGLFVYGELNLKLIFKTVSENMRSAASILILIGLANVFGSILVTERVPQAIANSILGFSTNKIVVILIINLILLFTGMFMESIAAILITFPVLLPVATSVGMDRVHFGIMAVLNLMIGLVTPPVGICLTTAAQIGRVSLVRSLRANMPFLIAMLIVLALVSFIPAITLFIPGLMG
jgi:tripartite ATP-independent transporter DctM subunit